MTRKKPAGYRCQELREYCNEWGAKTRFAEALGVSLCVLSLWINGQRKVPVERCFEIARLTNGFVQPEMLRPDLNFQK